MKHLPFLFFALLSAQLVAARSWVNKKHFEVGIAAGAGINSAFQVTRNSPLRMEWDGKLHPTTNVSVAYTSESWQYGVNAGYNSVSCKLADLGAGTNIHFNSGRETFITCPSAISYTYIPTRLFVNKLFR